MFDNSTPIPFPSGLPTDFWSPPAQKNREAKVQPAADAAKEKLALALKDPEVVKLINNRFAEIVRGQNEAVDPEKSYLRTSKAFFQIKQADIDKMDKAKVLSGVNIFHDPREFCAINTWLYIEEGIVCLHTDPKAAHELDHKELQKIYLHEMNHALLTASELPQRNQLLDSKDTEAQKIHCHTLELCCDALSDIVQAYPTMAEMRDRITLIRKPQNVASAEESSAKMRMAALMENSKDSLTHPSSKVRISTSLDTCQQLAQRRYDEFYSRHL
jgi:hypothetical protein